MNIKNTFLQQVHLAIRESEAAARRQQRAEERAAQQAADEARMAEQQAQKRQKRIDTLFQTSVQPLLDLVRNVKKSDTNEAVFQVTHTPCPSIPYTFCMVPVDCVRPEITNCISEKTMVIHVTEDRHIEYAYGLGFQPAKCSKAELIEKVALWIAKYAPEESELMARNESPAPKGRRRGLHPVPA